MNPKIMQLSIVNFLVAFILVMSFFFTSAIESPYLQLVSYCVIIGTSAIVFSNTAVSAYKAAHPEDDENKPKGKRSYGR